MNNQTLETDVIKTTIYNEKPQLIKLTCISCGGTLDIVDNNHAICPHCGRNHQINHAEKVKIDVTIDWAGRDQVHSMGIKLAIVLVIVLIIAVLIVVGIIGYNISVLTPTLLSPCLHLFVHPTFCKVFLPAT